MFKRFAKIDKTKNEQYDVLNRLRELDKYKADIYIEETQELVEAFQKDLMECINYVIENGLENEVAKEKTETLFAKSKEIDERLCTAKTKWEELRIEIEGVVEFGVDFIQKTNFYPPEYTFNINKLKGSTLEIDEHLKENPLYDPLEYKELIEKVKNDISDYKTLHEETIVLIEKIKKRKEQHGKEEKSEMLVVKEKLFRHLQMGNLIEARKELKKLRKELKKM